MPKPLWRPALHESGEDSGEYEALIMQWIMISDQVVSIPLHDSSRLLHFEPVSLSEQKSVSGELDLIEQKCG